MRAPILLIEDNPADVSLIVRALSQTELLTEIVTLNDGEEAVAYLLRNDLYADRSIENPAVIFLDLSLPGIDGFQVLERIKTHEELKSIPVVMLTASHDHKDMVRSYQLGANAFVVKPTDSVRFSEAIQELGLFWGRFNEPPPGSRQPFDGRAEHSGRCA